MAAARRTVTVVRWITRLWGTLAATLWGAFAVEHLAEWTGGPSSPPPLVWILVSLHVVMVLALIAAWRFERAAGALALATAAVFFAAVGVPNAWIFFASVAFPAAGYLYCGTRPV